MSNEEGNVDATSAITGGALSFIFGIQCLVFACWAFAAALIMASLVVWIWMLIDVVRRPDESFPNPTENTKLIWLLVVVLGGSIGALVYYFVVYRQVGAAPPA